MTFYDTVASLYDGLTAREKKVVDHIMARPEEAMTLNTKDLGQRAGASSATIVRLAQALGYSSYQQMMIDLARSGAKPPEQETVALSGMIEARLMQLLGIVQASIARTSAIIDVDVLREAARQVNAATMIYLYGVGASGLVAQDLMQKLIFINRQSVFHSDYSLSIASTAHITPDDLAIGFSYSGRNREVLFAIEAAKENGAKTIGFTRTNSQLSKLVDLHIPLAHIEDSVLQGSRLSRYAQSVAVDMLYMLLHDGSQENQEHVAETNRLVNKHSAGRRI
ncbi:MAG: MurR/RpiR family transcriptional regulator [Clostridia bacterium]|nr:MurR/RpiR family transcriptional regulator [Clostridia bacterium]